MTTQLNSHQQCCLADSVGRPIKFEEWDWHKSKAKQNNNNNLVNYIMIPHFHGMGSANILMLKDVKDMGMCDHTWYFLQQRGITPNKPMVDKNIMNTTTFMPVTV